MRNRSKNVKPVKNQLKIYPPKQEKEPIDKKALMERKRNCLTNLWFIRNMKFMHDRKKRKYKKKKHNHEKKKNKIFLPVISFLFGIFGDLLLDAFKSTKTAEHIIDLSICLFRLIGL